MDLKINCAGIVTYNPVISVLKRNIDAIYKNTDQIVIADNNSNNIKEIVMLITNYEKVKLLELEKNYGIAYALNKIVEEAKNKGFDWVMLLDQDSECDKNIFIKYNNFLLEHYNKKIALLTPYIIDINKMTIDDYSLLKLPEYSKVSFAITSASLINIDIYEKIGKFDNQLFIDCVDMDYSKRLELNGYEQIRINNTYLLQQVGNAEKTKILRIHKDNAGNVTIMPYYRTNHSLMRQYYIARNNIIMIKRYFVGIEKIKQSIFVFFYLFTKLFVEKDKIKLTKTIGKGVVDGINYAVKPYRMR